MELVRKYLTADEIGTPAIRWNSDCDCVQQSPDGGTTWVDVPQADPRSAAGYAMPPVSSDNPQCDGAERMVQALKRLIDIVVQSAGSVAAVSAVLGYLADFLFGIGTLVALILEAVTGLLALGQEVLDAAFTTDVYDQIKCYAEANLSADGHFTSGGWTGFQADVLAAFSGTVNIAMGIIFQLEGINGFNNADSVGTETGDCSACCVDGAGCFQWDFSIDEQGFEVCSVGTYVNPEWRQSCAGSLAQMNIGQGFGATPAPQISHVEMDLELIAAALPTDWYIYGLNSNTGTCGGDQVLLASGTITASGTVSADISPVDVYGFQLITSTTAGCGTSDCWLTAFRAISSNWCALGLHPNC